MSQQSDKFLSLFPLKGKLTEEIIKEAVLIDPGNCRGALTFKAALGENVSLLKYPDNVWGRSEGEMIIDDIVVTVTTESNIDFIKEKKPQEVVFVIHSYKPRTIFHKGSFTTENDDLIFVPTQTI